VIVTLVSAIVPAAGPSGPTGRSDAPRKPDAPTPPAASSCLAGRIRLVLGVALIRFGLSVGNEARSPSWGQAPWWSLGISALAPLFAAVASVIGQPMPGIAGRLPGERLPAAAAPAATASALMVGVALVTFVAILPRR
jgi:hypothetical protein